MPKERVEVFWYVKTRALPDRICGPRRASLFASGNNQCTDSNHAEYKKMDHHLLLSQGDIGPGQTHACCVCSW